MNKYQTAIVDHEGLIYVLEAITNLKREYTKNEVYIDDFKDVNPTNCNAKRIKNAEIITRVEQLRKEYNEKIQTLKTI
jgi:ribosome biogenesis protein Tsr3